MSKTKNSKSNRGRNLPLSISQNFLTKSSTIQRLLALSDISENDRVIEIGPGKGHITRALLRRGCELTAVELDLQLYRSLASSLQDQPRLKLIHGDFLKHALPRQGEYKVFANIPFALTTAIVRKLCLAANPPRDAWLIMERKAARRLLGQPQENQLALLLRPFFEMRMLSQLPRQEFHPMPAVDIVLFHFHRREEAELPWQDRGAFERFLDHAWKQGICGERPLLSRKQVDTALRLAKLPPIKASATLLYVQWLCLFRCYRRFAVRARR